MIAIDIDGMSDDRMCEFAANVLYYCGVMPTDYTYKDMPKHELAGGMRMAIRQLASNQP